jgi:hypothetical protein
MTRLTNLPAASILGALDQLYAVVGGNSRRIPAQAMSGRNLIINGSGRINQRGYTSGTATSGPNQFTLDRWFVVTSGQNLTFTGDNSRRVMTAPAGGVRQVVEGVNVLGGDHVLNWDGTATATVNGVARTKGEVFTLPANTNVVVGFAGGTFTDVQLERGTLATPFELRTFGQELALCERYYEVGTIAFSGNVTSGSTYIARVRFRTLKARSADLTRESGFNASFPTTGTISLPAGDNQAVQDQRNANATSSGTFVTNFTASAEFTS